MWMLRPCGLLVQRSRVLLSFPRQKDDYRDALSAAHGALWPAARGYRRRDRDFLPPPPMEGSRREKKRHLRACPGRAPPPGACLLRVGVCPAANRGEGSGTGVWGAASTSVADHPK